MQAFLNAIASEIRQLDSTEFWIWSSVAIVVTLFLFWRMASWYQNGRLIQNIPTARIRSAPQGYIELIGEAKMMAGHPIISPLSLIRCTWFSYKIEEQKREYDAKGGFRTRWRVVKQQTSEEVFLLQDDTGQCAIDPEGAEVITRNKRVWYKHDAVPPRRFTEWTILENEPLYAMGLFKTVGTVEDQSIRQQVSHTLREWKQNPEKLLQQYDTDQDGQINESEWQQARKDADLAVKRAIGQRAKEEQLSLLAKSSHKSQPYILSTIPEKQLVARYYRRAFAAMFGFVALGSTLVWAMNIRSVF